MSALAASEAGGSWGNLTSLLAPIARQALDANPSLNGERLRAIVRGLASGTATPNEVALRERNNELVDLYVASRSAASAPSRLDVPIALGCGRCFPVFILTATD